MASTSFLQRRDLLVFGGAASVSSLLARRARAQAKPGQAAISGSLEVDAREGPRRILKARLRYPARPGAFSLVYPKWLPGQHAPTGHINDLVGLQISAGGKRIGWRRDDEDMYQFHCELPAGTRDVTIELDYVTGAGGRASASPSTATAQLMVVEWGDVLVYPAGADPRTLQLAASVRLPADWSHACALTAAGKGRDPVRFQPASLETVIDSPLAAGLHARSLDITPPGGPPHQLQLFADSPEALGIKPAVQAGFQRLCAEAGSLFGGWPYRRYQFLLSLTDHLPHGGLEHHESSDNRVWERTLLDDAQWAVRSRLLPHELAHAWNGKLRRPEGLATRDYQQPMKTELLWIYEGLTSYVGDIVLSARAGLRGPEQSREALAWSAGALEVRSGRNWRPLVDTARSAPALWEAAREWQSWRRGLDYYPESALIWLEADVLIRQRSNGQRSLDDFCRQFHGQFAKGAPAVVPYKLDDVLAALNAVVPMDWRAFFQARVYTATARAPLGGIEQGGWKLVYKDTPTAFFRQVEQAYKEIDHSLSIGITLKEDGTVLDVNQGSPAARAGVGPASRVVAINGRRFTAQVLRAGVAATKTGTPLELLVEMNDYFRSHKLDWKGGLRYPALERDASRPDLLSAIFTPRQAAPAAPTAVPSAAAP
jgi:predicted metalloprotease with PDZ domain